MTLVELLVVIVLVSTLVATAIPVISPGGESRRLREASRNVNAYLQGAQARAIQTGRPFGVALQRAARETERPEDNAACVRLEYVEVPPTYSGFSDTSAARVSINPFYNPNADSPVLTQVAAPFVLEFVTRGETAVGMPAGWRGDLVPPRFLRVGDTIEIAGRRYVLLEGSLQTNSMTSTAGYLGSDDSTIPTGVVRALARPVGTPIGAALESLPPLNAAYGPNGSPLPSNDEIASYYYSSDGVELPAAAAQFAYRLAIGWTSETDRPFLWTEPKPYRIFRQPVPAGGEPYELPAGAAIDLQASVVSAGGSTALTQLHDPGLDVDDTIGTGLQTLRTDPILLMFAPEGHVHRLHGRVDAVGSAEAVTGFVALCVGRRELTPGQRFGAQAGVSTPLAYSNPFDMLGDPATPPPQDATALRGVTDLYNWLNLESRWVVIGGQSGAVSTVESTLADPLIDANGDGVPDIDLNGDGQLSTLEGIAAALEAVGNRTNVGGL